MSIFVLNQIGFYKNRSKVKYGFVIAKNFAVGKLSIQTHQRLLAKSPLFGGGFCLFGAWV